MPIPEREYETYGPANFPSATLSTEFLKRILLNIVYFLPKSNSTEMEITNRKKDVEFLPLIAIQEAAYQSRQFLSGMCIVSSLSGYSYTS